MGALINDVHFGLRMLVKNPGSTLAAIVALGFGIGANSAIFSVVNGVLLRPLPYKDPDRLVMVWETKLSKGVARERVTPPNYKAWVEQNRVFDRMAAFRTETGVLGGGVAPERVETGWLSAGGFELLGLQPVIGRVFSLEEGQPGHNSVAVLSYGLWQRHFGGERDVLGKTASLNGIGYTIIGVANPGFSLLDTPSELWIPYALDDKELDKHDRGNRKLRVIAHLKPGITLDQAQSEMRSMARRRELEDPEANSGYGASVVLLREQLVGDISTTLWILLGAVVIVLLIACANVANLLLARAGSREKEIAVRAALGANPGRLARQLLTESVLLALAGGLLGLLLAAWSIQILKQLGPATLPRLSEVTLDWRVLSFTLAISLATGLIFGLFPALSSLTADLNSTLRSSGRGSTGDRARSGLRSALVIAEIAICVVLLSGAGLLLRSFAQLQRVNPGFRPDHVLTMQVSLPETRYEGTKVAQFYKQLMDGLQVLPGVRFAGITRNVPLSGARDSSLNFSIENQPVLASADQPRAQFRAVSADYFEALGIPLVKGRYFDRTDGEKTPGVVVINETLAKRYWPHEDPLGKRIQSGLEDSPWCSIVGVVMDVKQMGLDTANKEETYYHYLQVPPAMMSMVEGTMTVVLRTDRDPVSLVSASRAEVQKLDRDLKVSDVITMDALLDGSLARPRFRTSLLGVFAGIALLLAAIGLYGVIAYSVAQRTNELGVRMALGAQKSDVLRMVMGQGAMLAVLGVAIGLLGAAGATRLLSNLLFGVNSMDPLTFLGTAGLIVVVSLAASAIPALRAIKVDPVIALRYE